jgi:predicted nuclease of predicted toxin-antitoxin system
VAAIRIYTNENVNPAIAEGLRRRGVEAWPAHKAGNLSLSDDEQLQYASQQRAVLFTHDPHLIVVAHQWVRQGQEHWGVIYVHQESLSIGECIRRLKDFAEILQAADMKNRVEYL